MTTRKKKRVPTLVEQDSLRSDLRDLERDANALESGALGFSTDEPENDVGKRLEYQRRAQALTQGQLAELTKQADASGKGLSRGVISLYELGINRPGIKEVRLLCEVLRISPSYLIFGDERPFQNKASAQYFGGVADTEPEFLAKAVYCLSRLDPEQSIALVQLMVGMLRSEYKSFDNLLAFHANSTFLDAANDLQAILAERDAKKKTK